MIRLVIALLMVTSSSLAGQRDDIRLLIDDGNEVKQDLKSLDSN